MNNSTTKTNVAQQEQHSILEKMAQFATWSRLLRLAGAFSVVASISLFLLQGWDAANDLNRFYLLLGQTLLLTAGGFFLGFILKENKGARLFFGLSLGSVMANLTTLGALVYSFINHDKLLSHYPDVAFWTVTNGYAVLLAFIAATIVLIPTALFGYRVMARHSASRLTLAYLISGSLLLIPVRSSLIIALISCGWILYGCFFTTRLRKKDKNLSTLEGRFALSLIFISPLIMLTRSIWLYEPVTLFYTIISIMLFLLFRFSTLELDTNSSIRKGLEFLSIPIAIVTSISLTHQINSLILVDYSLLIFASALMIHMIDLAKRSHVFGGPILFVSSLIMSFCFVIQIAIESTVLNGVLTIFAGTSIMLIAFIFRNRPVMRIGIISNMIAVMFLLSQLYQMINSFNWSSLGILGVIAIVLASLIERHGVYIKMRINQWQQMIQVKPE